KGKDGEEKADEEKKGDEEKKDFDNKKGAELDKDAAAKKESAKSKEVTDELQAKSKREAGPAAKGQPQEKKEHKGPGGGGGDATTGITPMLTGDFDDVRGEIKPGDRTRELFHGDDDGNMVVDLEGPEDDRFVGHDTTPSHGKGKDKGKHA